MCCSGAPLQGELGHCSYGIELARIQILMHSGFVGPRSQGTSQHPPSIIKLSSLESYITPLYIKVLLSRTLWFHLSPRHKKHCVCVRVIFMRHDTPLMIAFSAAWKSFWRRESTDEVRMCCRGCDMSFHRIQTYWTQVSYCCLWDVSRGIKLRPSLLSALASVVDHIFVVLAADKDWECVNELRVLIQII